MSFSQILSITVLMSNSPPPCRVAPETRREAADRQVLRRGLEVLVVDGFQNLVGFLDQHGLQRIEILLLVPGTTVRTPQRGHDFDELFELSTAVFAPLLIFCIWLSLTDYIGLAVC